MDHLSNNVAMCLGCENAEPLPLEAEDAPKPLGVKPQGPTVENLQKMQQKQGFYGEHNLAYQEYLGVYG